MISRLFYIISAIIGLLTIGYERYRQFKMVPPVRGFPSCAFFCDIHLKSNINLINYQI